MEHNREVECIRDVLRGQTRRFEALVAEYQTDAYNLCVRILGNAEDARDCTQDSFLKAFEALGTFRLDSRFSTWLYRIVYNTCISRLRKISPIVNPDLDRDIADSNFSHNDGLESLGRDDMKMLLDAAYRALTPEEVFLIDMFYREDCPVEELCQLTGLSRSNVKVRLHRSRVKMHRAIHSVLKEEIEIWQTR